MMVNLLTIFYVASQADPNPTLHWLTDAHISLLINMQRLPKALLKTSNSRVSLLKLTTCPVTSPASLNQSGSPCQFLQHRRNEKHISTSSAVHRVTLMCLAERAVLRTLSTDRGGQKCPGATPRYVWGPGAGDPLFYRVLEGAMGFVQTQQTPPLPSVSLLSCL